MIDDVFFHFWWHHRNLVSGLSITQQSCDIINCHQFTCQLYTVLEIHFPCKNITIPKSVRSKGYQLTTLDMILNMYNLLLLHSSLVTLMPLLHNIQKRVQHALFLCLIISLLSSFIVTCSVLRNSNSRE